MFEEFVLGLTNVETLILILGLIFIPPALGFFLAHLHEKWRTR